MAETWRNCRKSAVEVLPMIHKTKEILIFDTETTGLGKEDKIIQFSGIRYRILKGYEMEEIERMDIYINPEEPLSEKIVEITGITDELLKTAPTEGRVVKSIFHFLESSPLWAAYNCSFDLRMLRQMSERQGIPFVQSSCLDILEMARDILPKSEVGDHRLGTVTKYLFPDDNTQFHSSIEDVKASSECLTVFLNEYLKAYKAGTELKTQRHLEYAYFWINPQRPSQKRLCLVLNEGAKGAIFWDAVSQNWSHKSDKESKRIFASSDLSNLEKQVMNRYAWKYEVNTISDLCKCMEKAKRERDKKKAS